MRTLLTVGLAIALMGSPLEGQLEAYRGGRGDGVTTVAILDLGFEKISGKYMTFFLLGLRASLELERR